MRINFNLDQAITVLETISAINTKDEAKQIIIDSSKRILKSAVSKEIESNEARMSKIISTMDSSGYTNVSQHLNSALLKMKEQDTGRKGKYSEKK